MIEEGETLLIRNYGKCIFWVFPFQVSDKFGEFVVLSVLLDSVRQGFPANYGSEVAVRFSMDGGQDAAFEVDRPALGMSVNIIGPKARERADCLR